jgi:hypothetical protein
VPKRKYVITDSSNEQYPRVKDNGSGSGIGYLRGGMFIVPCSGQLKSGEMGERIIDQVSTK